MKRRDRDFRESGSQETEPKEQGASEIRNGEAERRRQRIKGEKEQRRQIREFDRELFSYTGQIAWFLPGMFSFIVLILAAIPVQDWDREDLNVIGMMVMFVVWISYSVLQPYVYAADALTAWQRKSSRTYDILKYLPVSKRQYNILRMQYLFRYVWKLTAIGLVLQCIAARLLVKKITIWNILYVIAVLFVTPSVAGWLQLKFSFSKE